MPRYIHETLDQYSIRVALAEDELPLTDPAADCKVLLISEDDTHIIEFPVPAEARPKLAALLVGMTPADAMNADVAAARDADEGSEVEAIAENDPAAEAASAGRCLRCGARDEDEQSTACINSSLLAIADREALEPLAEAGCARAIEGYEATS